MYALSQSRPTLHDPLNYIACQAPLSMGFSRQEYWSELPFPSPGDLPDPGIELRSPALQVGSLRSEPPRKLIPKPSDSYLHSRPSPTPSSYLHSHTCFFIEFHYMAVTVCPWEPCHLFVLSTQAFCITLRWIFQQSSFNKVMLPLE